MEGCIETFETAPVSDGMPEKRCYTVEELQVILNASRGTVYNLIKSNVFRSFQLGAGGKYRVSKKSFDDWLEKQL